MGEAQIPTSVTGGSMANHKTSASVNEQSSNDVLENDFFLCVCARSSMCECVCMYVCVCVYEWVLCI